MISDDNENNAELNQNKFNSLDENDKNTYIDGVYKYYKKTLPIIEHDINDIRICYKNLQLDQKYFLYEKPKSTTMLDKYNFKNLINFINKTHVKKIELKKKGQQFINFNLIIYDYDYKIHYVNICSLSDFYTNKERMKCQVLGHDIPIKYYEKNYYTILRKYFENLKKHYEYGLKINKLEFKNNEEDYKSAINTIYLQNTMYIHNKFCTVYKPYLFKLLINLFGAKRIIDLSSGWGDRLLASLSQQNDIELYVGIDPNKLLFEGYNKMIEDLCSKENKKKYILINSGAEKVEYVNYNDIDMIFWSPPFFDLEIYSTHKTQSLVLYNRYTKWENYFLIYVINLAVNRLRLNGVLILYVAKINYSSFLNKMANMSKLLYLGDIQIYSDKMKSYIIFVKTTESTKILLLDNSNSNNDVEIKKIKNKIENQEENPPLTIIILKVNEKKIILVQEGELVAGTKQRAAVEIMKYEVEKNPKITTLMYAGTYNGFGAIATAYAAYKLGLKSKVFLSKNKLGMKNVSSNDVIINSRQIKTLQALKSEIYLCENYREAKNLAYDYASIPTEKKFEWYNLPEYYITPMGLNDSKGVMVDILSKNIVKAIKKTEKLKIDIETYNGTIWCVAGSGGIVNALHQIFKKANICIYLTGGGNYYNIVFNWAIANKITILNNNKKYDVSNTKNDYKKYYKSVDNYDSLIWPWVKKYGKTDDILWNVSYD